MVSRHACDSRLRSYGRLIRYGLIGGAVSALWMQVAHSIERCQLFEEHRLMVVASRYGHGSQLGDLW